MKRIRCWIIFAGTWKILGFFVFLPFSYNLTDLPGWKAEEGSIETKFGYFANTHLAISFLVLGIFLFFTYRNPVKHSLFILLNIVIHLYVYVLNLLSVHMGINNIEVIAITQIDLLIVIFGAIVYVRLIRTNKAAPPVISAR